MLTRALYFYVYKKRLLMKLRVHTPLLVNIEGGSANEAYELVKKYCFAVRTHLEDKPQFGENSEIFWFRIDHSQRKKLVSCHMQFYGGFDIFVTGNE